MTKLLYIEASPRKDRSYSIKVARAFLDAYRVANPEHVVEAVDLWQLALPEFAGTTIDAKYRILHGQQHTTAEAKAWETVTEIANRFKAAERYLFSLPMWNFGLPYKLKHFLDVIIQPGLTFSYSPESGYTGLVSGRPAVIIAARGGEYTSSPAAVALDFQLPYLKTLLGFIGFTDIRAITIEPTLAGGPAAAEAALTTAQDQARRMAAAM